MYSSISTPVVPSPPYEESIPTITPFAEDRFSVGPSYSQNQVPESRPTGHIQVQDNTPPTVLRVSGNGAHASNSVLTMPIPGTKLAPEKFRGDFHKVKEFVQHYERLCIQNNVTSDQEKCETLLRYCSKREKQTIKNIPSFNTSNWSKLRSDMLKLYDADLDTKRYKVKDIRSFSRRQKAKRIKDLATWKKYCRKFLRIAGSLLNGAKISSKEYATYFWQGIPKALKVRIENRILTRNPVRDLSEPFSIGEIDTAAEAILQRDRFDTALDDSESEDGGSSGEESDSEGSDTSSSDSDSEDEKKRRRSKSKNKSSRERSLNRSAAKQETSRKRVVNGSRKEVEGLIRQMSLLTQDDPNYGLAYYRAMKLDADISKVVSEPVLRPKIILSQPQSNVASYRQTVQPFNQPYATPPSTLNYSPPANFPPRNLMANQGPVPSMPPPRGSEIVCYGCGEKGHGLSNCVGILNLLSSGQITKDIGGRIVRKDGLPIRRINGETFIQALEREERPQSHLITIQDLSDGYESDSEDEEEEDMVFAIREDDVEVYEVERPAKQIATKRKMVMDGIYPPRLKDLRGGKENHPAKNPETGRTTRMTKNQPKPVGIPKEIKRKSKSGDPIPIDVQKPRYDGANDEEIIEDLISPATRDILMRDPAPIKASEDKVAERKPLRKSAVSAHINPFKILDQVLSTKVELAVGEVIGVSRELSMLLADSIKVKNQPFVPVGLATSFRTKTRGLLIKLSMECDGNSIQAIIDTGSQLNIISEGACNAKIRRPIDRKTSVAMNDANGGEGNLHGIVENVPLNCGGVMTHANLYVGSHVPFDLLLGRPWQRGNFVSIDERRDGTYLLFKDPQNLEEARYEVLVTPDSMNQVEWDFDPSTWLAYEAPTSYFIDYDKGNSLEGNRKTGSRFEIPDLEVRKLSSLSHNERKSRKILGIENVIADEVLRYAAEYISKEHKEKGIKGLRSNDEKPNISPPEPSMAMQLGTARVQHEADLPSLFSSPLSTRTEAERLLMGQGDLTHFGNSQHIRHVIASSASGVIVGHLPDQHGNPRTDVMLFNMGLLTSLAPNAPNSSSPLESTPAVDIQHGLGILHFYPNLGGGAPSNWQIPVFVPPVQASVSSSQWCSEDDWADYKSPQVPASSAINFSQNIRPSVFRNAASTLESPRPRSRPFGFAADRDSNFDFSSDSDSTFDDESSLDDETAVSCMHCLASHFGPCPCLSRNSIILNRVSSTGSVNSDVITQSIPELESLSNSSDSDNLSYLTLPNEQIKRKRDIVQVMTEDRVRRLRDWTDYEQEIEVERDRFRQEDMIRGIGNIVAEREGSMSPGDGVMSRTLRDSSSNFLMTVDPRLLTAPGRAERIEITPDSSSFTGQVLDLNQARRCASRNLSLGTEEGLMKTRQPSIGVFSVTLASPPSSPELRRTVPLPPSDSIPVITPSRRETLSPELQYPDSPRSYYDNPPLPTIVYGSDTAQMLIQGELQEQVPAYLTSPILYPEDRFPNSLNEVLTMNTECHLADPPSPTDTEPVDHTIVPKRRQFPPSRMPEPVREKSPDVDMEYGMQIPLYVRPFVDDHLPNKIGNVSFGPQSVSRLGPQTNRSIPIHLRTYYPYADAKVHFPIPRVDRVAVIDTSKMGFPGPSESLTRASFSGRTQIFSVLAPRPPAFEHVLFPGLIYPNQCGPLDLPNVTAMTLGERYVQLREARFSIISLYSRIREVLPRWLVEELDDPRLTLYVARGEELEKKYVDRGNFFRSLHPVYNPLVTEREAMYFRGAAYAYYRFRQDVIGDTIDQLLRSPHYDHQLCRELLEMGCLDEYGRDEKAYRFLELYEDLAKGEDDELGDDDMAYDN
jgi:hypothetical protein